MVSLSAGALHDGLAAGTACNRCVGVTVNVCLGACVSNDECACVCDGD